MSLNGTAKCGICGKPYKFYSMMVGDQSACPACVQAGEDACRRPSNSGEERARREFFGLGSR